MKILSIIQWVVAVFFGLCALGNGLHWSSVLLVLAAVLMLPVKPIRDFLSNIKIKKVFAIGLAVILFIIGIFASPSTSETYYEDDLLEITTDSTYKKIESTNGIDIPLITEKSTSEQNCETQQGITESTTENTTKKESDDKSVGNGNQNLTVSQIPKYSGTAFVVINNNIPSFNSSELSTIGYERYSPLDSKGRCGVAIASCGKEIMPKEGEERGSISNIKPSGWIQAKYSGISGGYLWNRCHLIGWQLSAENANKQNLITGTRYMNINGMLQFENMVADYIKETNNHVAYRVTPIYKGNNLVASGVQIEAYSIEDNGDGICFNVYCYNVQPGITINYATGESSGSQTDTTEKNTTIKTTEKETEKQTTSQNVNVDTDNNLVWIPNSGSKYHVRSSCSNMKNPSQVTKSEAEQRGYEPCKKCY